MAGDPARGFQNPSRPATVNADRHSGRELVCDGIDGISRPFQRIGRTEGPGSATGVAEKECGHRLKNSFVIRRPARAFSSRCWKTYSSGRLKSRTSTTWTG